MPIDLSCRACGKPVDPAGAAVLGYRGGLLMYFPFVEDIRFHSPDDFWHPQCFAERHGLNVFVQLVAENDRRQRDARAQRK